MLALQRHDGVASRHVAVPGLQVQAGLLRGRTADVHHAVHPSVLTGFGSAADAYDRMRPEYPQAAVDWLVDRLGITAESAVVDLAAGTGKLTRALVPTGARVVAVEPVDDMRAHIQTEAIAGYAESMPLPDGFADAVTVGQAFHWFSSDEALAEIARVLRPDGRLGLIWNGRENDVPVQRAFTEIIEELRTDEAAWKRDAWRDVLEASPRFGPIEETAVPWERTLDGDELAELASSISFVASAAPARRAAVLERVRALTPDGPVAFPYVTNVFVAPVLVDLGT
jgi:ubiquinone/menaquinone biosynthesis C-methylase UbiE